MIWWRPEGTGLRPGWNIYLSWRDFQINYLEVDISSGQCKNTRVRWRWALPKGTLTWGSFWGMEQWNLIDYWMFDHNTVMLPREWVEDHNGIESILPELSQLYKHVRARYEI